MRKREKGKLLFFGIINLIFGTLISGTSSNRQRQGYYRLWLLATRLLKRYFPETARSPLRVLRGFHACH